MDGEDPSSSPICCPDSLFSTIIIFLYGGPNDLLLLAQGEEGIGSNNTENKPWIALYHGLDEDAVDLS